MKNALISPNELSYNPWTGEQVGVRIAEVSDTTFEVADPLFWVECEDGVSSYGWYWLDGAFGQHAEPEATLTEIPVTEV